MKLTVIIASVREGRQGEAVARWFVERATQHGKFDVEVADLKEHDLPIFDEPHHPRLKKYVHDSTKQWSALVDGSDAFVFVTPEYNYTMPPALVNALDTLYHEWTYKPVGFVSYGGVSGGIRSVQTAKLMVTGFKMMPMVEAVNIPFFTQLIENGVFKSNETYDKAVPVMLDELLKWTEALKPLRV
ncbi:MAG TPA: NADPH-dependent FMN reductase [Vicinamibacterales bacterium]|nr:NADPH-dependent FMN reductase [Vicinamibacterales bacterium]